MKKVLFLVIWLVAGIAGIAVSESGFASRRWDDRSRGMLDLSLVTIDVDVSGHRILCASETRVYLSENRGRTWRKVLKPRLLHDWDDRSADDVEIEREEDDLRVDIEQRFDRSEYDYDELYEMDILDAGEDIDSLSDEELQELLEAAGILETLDAVEWEDEDQDAVEKDIESVFETETLSVRQVCWNPVYRRYAYAATSHGLYVSSDGGWRWTKTTVTDTENVDDVQGITALSPEGLVVVALQDGMYMSYDQGVTFTKQDSVPSHRQFLDMEADRHLDNSIVALSESSVVWGRIGDQVQSEPIQIQTGTGTTRLITVTDSGRIVVADGNTFLSMTEMGQWESFLIPELSGTEIREIDVSDQSIVCATNRGVYFWNIPTKKGRYLNAGLTDYDIRDIAVNPRNTGEIWIASALGAFVFVPGDPIAPEISFKRYIPENFPMLEELIHKSLQHAEIDLFRDRARFDNLTKGVWFPQIDVICRVAPRTRHQITRSTVSSVSGGHYYTGPISERYVYWDRDRFGIHVRLSWKPNLAIFNRYELPAHLRLRNENTRKNRHMHDVRRLYTMLAQLYQEKQRVEDARHEIDYCLRIQQVQAQLDALTGYTYDQLSQAVILENTRRSCDE